MRNTLVLLIIAIATLCTSLTASAAATTTPFVTTSIENGEFAADTHWYSINVRNGKYLYVDNDTHQVYCAYRAAPTADMQEFLWAFTGNATDGYRFYNSTTGATLCLGCNEVDNNVFPTMSADAAYNTFRLKSNEDGFSVYFDGFSDAYLNDKGGNGYIGIWTNTAGATSAGSRMVFTEIEPTDTGGDGGGTVTPQPDSPYLDTFTMLLRTAKQIYDANSVYVGEGLLRKPEQIYSPFSQNDLGTIKEGGGFEALIDGAPSTYWHSYWQGGAVAAGYHYIRCTAPEDVGVFEGEYTVSTTRRNSFNDHPTQFVVYGTNDFCPDSPDDGATWTEVGTINFEAGGAGSSATTTLYVARPYRYLRFNCTTTTNNRGYFHMAEFQITGEQSLSPTCPNALYPAAAAALAAAIAKAQAILDAYYEGSGTITDTDVSAMRQAINAYRAAIPVLITSLSISPTSFTAYEIGAQQTLRATIQPNNSSNTSLLWTTSDASVATVSSKGVITANGGGECIITATTTDGSNLSAQCHVTVFGQTDYSALCINEIQVGNIDQYLDPSFNYGGWIELYNSSDAPIPLLGLYVVGTDHNGAEEVPFHFLFPNDDRYDYGYVPAHGFKNIWFDHYAVYDNKPITEHEAYKQVYWKLDRDGGHVAILAGDGQSVICEADYPAMPPRSSYARTTDGGSTWAWHASGTPESSNINARDYLSAPQQLTEPEVSTESQVYGGGFIAFNVSIPEGATLRYTTDGSTPTESSAESQNGNFSVSYGNQTYRFRLFQEGFLPSPVVTRSFINQGKTNVPILSVTTADANLNDKSYGVFSTSPNGRVGQGASTPTNRNMDWERPVNFEYFDLTTQGDAYQCVINQETDFSIAGGWTRNSAARPPFKIKAAEQYDGHKYLHYPVFKSKPYNKNRTLLMRDENNLTDPGLQEIARRSGLYLDTQAWEPGQLYINGKSYGYVPIREPNNKHFALANYGIDTDEVDVFEIHCDSNYVQSTGTREAFDRWCTLAEQCGKDEAAYRELCDLVDVEEYMNYMAVELYLGNNDWPWNNFKGFRARDGKFHMVLMDVGHRICTITNSFANLKDYTTRHYRAWLGPTPTAQIFYNMIENEQFRRHFIDAFCLVAYSVYDPDFVREVANDMAAQVSSATYMSAADLTNRLNASRQATMLQQLMLNFPEGRVNDADRFNIALQPNIEGARLHLNGLPIPRQHFNGSLFAPVTLTAEAPEGYAFKGWTDAEGRILSADREWTISEGNHYDFGSVTAFFSPRTAADSTPPVRINEVSAGNDIYVNELWDRKDWIELYNNTDQPIDAAGLYLSDNPAKPTKWQIPAATDLGIDGASTANTVIPPHGTLIVWCDKEPAGRQLHASFKLSNDDGCTVTLQAEDGSWTDSFSYNAHGSRESVGRYPDGTDHTYVFTRPTIDAPNYFGFFGFRRLDAATIGTVTAIIDRALKGQATLSDIEAAVDRVLNDE